MKKYSIFTVLVVLLLFFAVSCAQSVDEEDKVVQVGFSAQYGDEDSSRSLKIDVDTDYKVEDLFWTYKAVKKSGIHTRGQQTAHVSLSAGDTRGLAGYVKEFSTGKWDLEIKGYLDKDHTDSKLIYSGSVSNYEITESATDNTVIPIKLTLSDGYDDGTLEFGTLKIKVPENRTFSASSVLTTTINDVTSGTADKIAESTTSLTAAKSAGAEITLSNFTFVSGKNKFVTGAGETTAVRTFQVLIKYKDNSVTGTGDEPDMFSGKFSVVFRKGCTTTISGDFNDYVKTFYPLHVLGGKVFYIKPATRPTTSSTSVSSKVYGNKYGEVWTKGNLYIFYKEDGTPVDLSSKVYQSKYSVMYNENQRDVTSMICEQTADKTMLSKLNADAVYYTVAKKTSTDDCVFVGDVFKLGIDGVSYGYSAAVATPSRVSSEGGTVFTSYGIGMGKTNTSALKGVSGIRGSGTDFNTLFDYLAWMNGETYNSALWGTRRKRIAGCTDWYVPSMYEMQVMFTSGNAIPTFESYFNAVNTDATAGLGHVHYYTSCTKGTASTSQADCWVRMYEGGSGSTDYPLSAGANPKYIRNGSINKNSRYTVSNKYMNGYVLVRSF